MSSPVLWYATRATGLVALVLLTATTVLGVLTANRSATVRWPGFSVQDLHRRLSVTAMAFLACHILTSVLDSYVHIGWTAIVVPFASSYKRLWVGLGSVGIDLLLAVAVTSHLRHKIRAGTWRAVHWLAYLSWPVALSHAFGMGTDMRQGWVIALTVSCMAAVIGAALWRISLAARRKGHALALIPVQRRPRGVPVKHISAQP
ncbi:MAG TPA: ferric reductase-like transmembrane domain-containing protein [Acidimicrobiales bacterium]